MKPCGSVFPQECLRTFHEARLEEGGILLNDSLYVFDSLDCAAAHGAPAFAWIGYATVFESQSIETDVHGHFDPVLNVPLVVILVCQREETGALPEDGLP